MFSNLQKFLKEKGIRLVLIDVDGTLGNLVQEHMLVIKEMVRVRVNLETKKIYDFRIWLNKIFMIFVRIGIFPTNKNMQIILCFINSILFIEPFESFKEEYLRESMITKKAFVSSGQFLNELERLNVKYLLVSKNPRSNRFFYDSISKPITISKNSGNKLDIFKEVIKRVSFNEGYDILPEQVLVIGDNFWDDIVPAMKLNLNVLWCNKYQSKIKEKCNYYLRKLFYKKALDNTEKNSIW